MTHYRMTLSIRNMSQGAFGFRYPHTEGSEMLDVSICYIASHYIIAISSSDTQVVVAINVDNSSLAKALRGQNAFIQRWCV